MRPDAATVLISMGFDALVDFEASATQDDVSLTWKSATPMPSQAEIDAYDMSPAATAARLQTKRRAAAKAILNDPEALSIIFRGKAIVDFKLFKTLLPTLTKDAYLKMIRDEIDAGQADV